MEGLILTAEQIAALALVVWAVIQFGKIVWVGIFKKPKPKKGTMRVIVFVIAMPFAYFWSGVALPIPGENPVEFAVALVAAASQILIFSGLIYDYILGGVFKWLDSAVLRRETHNPILAP
jgi:hypothetical protein